MKIVCPACGFTREVDEGALSPAAALATCPRCKERFRFREPAATDRAAAAAQAADMPEAVEASAPEDNALPPGAVIPPRTRDLRDAELFSHPRDDGSPRESRLPPEDSEDEQETRRQADAAYRRAAAWPPPESAELSNPWENPQDGYIAAFYQTAVRVLFAASRFFAGLEPQRTLARALTFYLIAGLIKICAEQFWMEVFATVLAPRAESDPLLAQLLANMSPPDVSLPLLILARTAFICFELFVAAGLYYLLFRIVTPNKANFSLIFQVIAYASAPVLLGIIPVLGSLTGFLWSLACSVVGCRYALRITWLQTAQALAPLGLVLLFLLWQAGALILQVMTLST